MTNNNKTDVASLKKYILFKFLGTFCMKFHNHRQGIFLFIVAPFIQMHDFVWNGKVYNY